MISRKKRQRYKEAARQLAASNNLDINLDNWEEVWNLLDSVNKPIPTYVYVIGEAAPNVVKIGRSNNPGYRLKALQTSHSKQLYLIAFCLEDEEFNEKKLHQKFAANRLFGEWFQFTQEIRTTAHKIKDKGLASQ